MLENTLFYGDNLPILQEQLPAESVDLIYLDPPFNSNRNYSVLFKDESGQESESQIRAFQDTWHWNETAVFAYHRLIADAPEPVASVIGAMYSFIGGNQMMAYLVMMALRLVELRRVLKPTGSLYLHCDSTASHYLKILLDTVFGVQNFRNEIIWQRTSSHNDSKKWADVHDVIFFYTKSDKFTWNGAFTPHDPKYVQQFYRFEDERGKYRLDHIIRSASMGPRPNLVYEYKSYTPEWGWRMVREKLEALDADSRLEWSKSGRPYLKRYLHEQKGTPIKSVVTDIPPISAQAAERMGYPTQKPLELLERILLASSNPGDVVLDPFCGCGTTVAAAQKLGRRWMGIDITHLAIALQRYRLESMFPGIQFRVVGEPQDVAAARQLARENRYQFQWWALSLVRAKPLGGETGSKEGKKGKDRGIDGVINFIDDSSGKAKRVIVQVKSGKVKSGDIRDLIGTLQREQAQLAVFITLEPASKEMLAEAATAGFYESLGWGQNFPRCQILTIGQLLEGAKVQMPPAFGTFKQAQKVNGETAVLQGQLDL